jgi:hypothetical protein
MDDGQDQPKTKKKPIALSLDMAKITKEPTKKEDAKTFENGSISAKRTLGNHRTYGKLRSANDTNRN